MSLAEGELRLRGLHRRSGTAQTVNAALFTGAWNPGNLTGCEAGRKRRFVGNETCFAARPDGRY